MLCLPKIFIMLKLQDKIVEGIRPQDGLPPDTHPLWPSFQILAFQALSAKTVQLIITNDLIGPFCPHCTWTSA
jgi:hypothetical protein